MQAALEKSSCSTAGEQKAATACFACTAANCTGTCYAIPCGRYINASQQVPPPPGFLSFVTGCNTTYISNCNDLRTDPTAVPPCQAYSFNSFGVGGWGNNTCINSSVLLQSVGCV